MAMVFLYLTGGTEKGLKPPAGEPRFELIGFRIRMSGHNCLSLRTKGDVDT